MRDWIPAVEGMSRARAAELKYFCRQYPEKAARLAALRGGFNDFRADGQPRGRGRASDSTARRAMKALQSRDREDVAMIEAAARAATEGREALYRCLMKNVTEGAGVMSLDIPMGLRQFYAMRRRFFMTLDEMQRAGL